ncbi:MAG: imidazole glycerol phosphate synthase subunit HisH [Pseudomonadota bacterium]|nr:imidazole glycerol phosphate synthase subunit HisH [Burkholderiales bacterium]MDQ3195401.1 imidazole glycerol phosphate synthase subunit HisH [Pseudomonadota bacterium]
MIAVVDYGMGNLRSVAKALQHVAPQASIVVTGDPQTIRGAERVVFPGQGAMPDCMRELETRGLREAVTDAARTRPFLGLCIGLQMLFEHSEEGDTRGLGLLPGKVKRFPRDGMLDAQGGRLKVPHMGWNEVEQSVDPQRIHPLWQGIPQRARFYFVHSYYVETGDAQLPCATTDYAFRFTCAVAKDNIFAVQFHPEKSQTAGLTLLSNFMQWRV